MESVTLDFYGRTTNRRNVELGGSTFSFQG
jgi:hypothetical protein